MSALFGPVQRDSGSYVVECFRWEVTIGNTPDTVQKGGERVFATYTISTTSDLDLTLKLKLASSASTKLLWRNVYCEVMVRAPAPEDERDDVNRGGSCITAEPERTVEVQVGSRYSAQAGSCETLSASDYCS